MAVPRLTNVSRLPSAPYKYTSLVTDPRQVRGINNKALVSQTTNKFLQRYVHTCHLFPGGVSHQRRFRFPETRRGRVTTNRNLASALVLGLFLCLSACLSVCLFVCLAFFGPLSNLQTVTQFTLL